MNIAVLSTFATILFLVDAAVSGASSMSSASFTVQGASINGGGAVGMVSERGAGSAFGEVGATIGQGGPIGIGQDDPLLVTLEAGFWPIVASLAPLDTDGDGVPDTSDNCLMVANVDQLDTDGDGIGNRCDCDFNQDNFCGGPDFTLFIGCFNASTGGDSTCEAADMNGDGFVGGPDFTLFIGGFNGPPGPGAPLP